ncbi:MAG: 6,7-dimethyl-8-ribityllumazine synthase [Planctomycetota bacterium]|jgi:6,7-dimethyl-8-ribityllumazine synthase
MTTHIEGKLTLADESIAIVVSRFNELVTNRLLDGALSTIRRHGGNEDNVTIVRAPGSFEIPLIADKLSHSGKFNAVICLGAVIQGQTTHHEYINQQVAAGLMRASQSSGIPVTFGILTCETMEQALDRSGGKVGNKGDEATLAAVETLSALRQLRDSGIIQG